MATVIVVIVSYRSADLVVDCLRTIDAERSRSGLNIRAFVTDNASGDFEALSQAATRNGWGAWVTIIEAPRNGGFAYGNNFGIRYALHNQANYVFLLNPDTEVRPSALESLVRFFEAHPRVGIAGSGIENEDGTEWPIAFRFPGLISEFCEAVNVGFVTRLFHRWTVAQRMDSVARPVDWVSGAAIMVRAEVFRRIGGLDENYFLYFEETDFCWRAKRACFDTWYVPQSRVMHIAGQSTKLMEHGSTPKRLPPYWFESRRRFFAITHGLSKARLIDFVVLLSYPIGWLKRLLLRKSHLAVPHFLGDFWSHSILLPRNAKVPTLRTSSPAIEPRQGCPGRHMRREIGSARSLPK